MFPWSTWYEQLICRSLKDKVALNLKIKTISRIVANDDQFVDCAQNKLWSYS